IELEETDWVIIRLALSVIATVLFIGLFLNSLLFITTLRSSNLRSTCNILIGWCSLFDVIHQVTEDYFLRSAFPLVFSVCSASG
ncbi:hypothetical protein PENTCL1PPCAC_17146, partial [Pristionchus entomophagus]